MYILSNTEADQLDFENQERLFDIISDITYQSGSQENLTDNLTKLRNAAVKSGQRDLFDKAMKKTREIVESDDGFISSGLVLKYKYTFDDFAYTEAPYMEVFSQPTAFLQKRAVEAVAANAKETGFGNFKTMYKTFAASMRKINESPAGSIAINPTDFPNQPLELECGEWNCDYSGVSRTTSMYTEIACHHPVMPVERLTNVDTYAEKLKIAYYRDGFWREIISGKRDLFDAAKVIKLADYGVSVTSKSAKLLSEFLCFMEANNSEVLPCRECVSRLGYVGDGSRFSPFDNSLVFDGEADFGMIFNSIKSSGTFEKWLDIAVSCRNDSITAQIMLASSFASVLIKRIGGLPFSFISGEVRNRKIRCFNAGGFRMGKSRNRTIYPDLQCYAGRNGKTCGILQ